MKELLTVRLNFGGERSARPWLVGAVAALALVCAVSLELHQRSRSNASELVLLQNEIRAAEAAAAPVFAQNKNSAAHETALAYPWDEEFALLVAAAASPKVLIIEWRVDQTSGTRELILMADSTADALAAAEAMNQTAGRRVVEVSRISLEDNRQGGAVRASLVAAPTSGRPAVTDRR